MIKTIIACTKHRQTFHNRILEKKNIPIRTNSIPFWVSQNLHTNPSNHALFKVWRSLIQLKRFTNVWSNWKTFRNLVFKWKTQNSDPNKRHFSQLSKHLKIWFPNLDHEPLVKIFIIDSSHRKWNRTKTYSPYQESNRLMFHNLPIEDFKIHTGGAQ